MKLIFTALLATTAAIRLQKKGKGPAFDFGKANDDDIWRHCGGSQDTSGILTEDKLGACLEKFAKSSPGGEKSPQT